MSTCRLSSVYSLALLTLLAVMACTHTPNETRSSRSANLITADEIRPNHTTAFDIVRDLKPRWLRSRGGVSIQNQSVVRVYVDGVAMGGADALGTISSSAVGQIEFMDASTATQRYGTNHASGVILVSTRRP